MPAAKAHRYLVSFARMGLVEQQAETGLYDLGGFALELGLSALARLDPVTLAASVLAELREATGQTVAVAVWANYGPTIVRWLGADAPVSASLRTGAVMPLTRSATGQAFLAFLPQETTAPWVKKELADNLRQGLTPTGRDEVDQLSAIRGPVRAHFGSIARQGRRAVPTPGDCRATGSVTPDTLCRNACGEVLRYGEPLACTAQSR